MFLSQTPWEALDVDESKIILQDWISISCNAQYWKRIKLLLLLILTLICKIKTKDWVSSYIRYLMRSLDDKSNEVTNIKVGINPFNIPSNEYLADTWIIQLSYMPLRARIINVQPRAKVEIRLRLWKPYYNSIIET